MYLTFKYIHTFRFCIRSFRNRYDWSFLYKQLTNLHDLEIVENNFTQRRCDQSKNIVGEFCLPFHFSKGTSLSITQVRIHITNTSIFTNPSFTIKQGKNSDQTMNVNVYISEMNIHENTRFQHKNMLPLAQYE